MRRYFSPFFLCIAIIALPASDAPRYRTLHTSALVVDGHNDILARVMKGVNIETRTRGGHSDLPRFRDGGVDVQLFSVWVPTKLRGEKGWRYALAEIDSLRAIAARNPDRLAIATRAGDIERITAGGLLAGVLALEGATCVDGRRDRIIALYRRGLRSFGPTWNVSTSWASSSKDEAAGSVRAGLSANGKSFVRLLDSLGVLIDLSHSGERTFWDVAATSTHPLFASHSGCAAIRAHHRNLTDAQLRAIAKSDGVAMMTYVPSFLMSNLGTKRIARMREFEARATALKKRYPRRDAAFLKEYDALIAAATAEKLCTIDDVVAHILHAVRVAGAAHVGLGSDFDGIGLTPVGLHDVTDLPMLTRALLKKGVSEQDIRGILGANFLRVWNRVVD
ncbi:MAG: dipeptidase [Bacteroidota bacterium]|jgi:membrane dipeptidase|nr:dipeptidase [Bacteroidota bacterium]